MTTDQKPWRAEMPLPEEYRVELCRFLRAEANDRSRLASGASYEWQSRCQTHLTNAADALSALPDIFSRCNEELAKVRAERDAVSRELARVRWDLENAIADAASYRMDVSRTVGRYYSAEGHGESPASDEEVLDGIRQLTFFEHQYIDAQAELDAARARIAELEAASADREESNRSIMCAYCGEVIFRYTGELSDAAHLECIAECHRHDPACKKNPLAARIAELEAAQQWRPASEAQDGIPMVIRIRDGRIVVATRTGVPSDGYDPENSLLDKVLSFIVGTWFGNGERFDADMVTHCFPLPEPPKEGT